MEDYIFLIVFGIVSFAVIVIGIAIRKSQQKEEAERTRFAKNAKKRAEAAKSVKKIQWKDQFSIDGGIIDRDHKTLFGLVNEFNEGISIYQKPEQMVAILVSLTNYTQTHFQREEKLQQASGFSFCEDHKKEHGDLIEKFNGLKQKAMGANEDNITDVAVQIGSFLQEWITGHVLESDLPLKPYVDRMREEAESMEEMASKNKNHILEKADTPLDAEIQ